ncbi:hypothetical protein HPB48_021245 [Haemaphysalis longicornis]|uniref:Uncharacterized protein n=1 Tax=Haemaphysalis longicornis TaxID=44386 RepID=A0A9J6H2L3_HAELO|nr:hypothetical protein HPB48_021245 [Haemaphysalis longicornis]
MAHAAAAAAVQQSSLFCETPTRGQRRLGKRHSPTPAGWAHEISGQSGRRATERPARIFSPRRGPLAAHAVVPNGDAPRDATSLLQQASSLIESLSGALKVSLEAPKLSRPLVRLEIPVYRGYEDTISVTDFTIWDSATAICSLVSCQSCLRSKQRSGTSLPVTDPPRSLNSRRQSVASFFQWTAIGGRGCVRSIEKLYQIAEPTALNDEHVERVIRQAQPTFAAYLRGARFRVLEERAAERIALFLRQARLLSPACAWKGASSFSRHPPDATHAVGAEDEGLLEISERALDRYTYGRHTANARKKPATTALYSQVRRQAETLQGMPIAGKPVKRGPHEAQLLPAAGAVGETQVPAERENPFGRSNSGPSLGRPGYPVGGPAPFISGVPSCVQPCQRCCACRRRRKVDSSMVRAEESMSFYRLPSQSVPVILGRDFLRKSRITIDITIPLSDPRCQPPRRRLDMPTSRAK